MGNCPTSCHTATDILVTKAVLSVETGHHLPSCILLYQGGKWCLHYRTGRLNSLLLTKIRSNYPSYSPPLWSLALGLPVCLSGSLLAGSWLRLKLSAKKTLLILTRSLASRSPVSPETRLASSAVRQAPMRLRFAPQWHVYPGVILFSIGLGNVFWTERKLRRVLTLDRSSIR